MRSVVIAAGLLTGVIVFAPSRAAAQDPETPPPPPRAPQEVAVPRGEVRSPRQEKAAPENRAPERARATERAVARPVRDPAPAVSHTPVPASSAISNEEQQGAQPRGSVRRPPASGGSIDGRPVDRAVPRSEAERLPTPRTTIIRNYPRRDYPNYSLYYYPGGFGSFGIGYFYYSPWSWAPYRAYGYGYPVASGFDIGSVKLKVKPRDAEVWVDGYYAGSVDDFDGVFQALKLDMGAYRIEVRKPGFETLTFDVRVQPERTITFRGDMHPVP